MVFDREEFVVVPFRPLLGLRSGFWQTLMGRYWPVMEPPPKESPNNVSLEEEVELSDSDKIVLDWTPAEGKAKRRLVCFVHGLAGDSSSNYMVRWASLAQSRGYDSYRMNLRGCGPGEGKANKLYHSGRSDDLFEVLKWINKKHTGRPVTVVAVSLGANLSLKLAGEKGTSKIEGMDSLIAISAPLNLKACSERLSRFPTSIFDRYFLIELMKLIHKRQRSQPLEQSGRGGLAQEMIKSLPEPIWKSLPSLFNYSLKHFDEAFTAPLSGFKNADEYYALSSSYAFLESIRVKTLLIHSLDDPIVSPREYEALPSNPAITPVLTSAGGHVGFISDPWPGQRWLDRLIFRYLDWYGGHDG